MSKQLVYESESNESIINVYCFTKFELQRYIVYNYVTTRFGNLSHFETGTSHFATSMVLSRGPTRYRYTAGRYDLSRNRYKNSDTENRYTKTLTFATIHQQNDSLFEVMLMSLIY